MNHASFITETRGVRLMADCWLFGDAFNHGWALLSETAMQPEDFGTITHLWFSHEHPDHFSPRSLQGIPAEHRSRITVLYQRTLDGKLAKFCRGLGFREVVELPDAEPLALTPEVRIRCGRWGSGDSWLLIESPEGKVLNLNDCDVRTSEEVAEVYALTGPVDLLATQFSYAAWNGNQEQGEHRRHIAHGMLERMKKQIDGLGARFVLPFASFVWFCHEQNDFMNEDANKIDVTERFLREHTAARPVVLYPGDAWPLGEPRDNSSALERYGRDYAELPSRPRAKAENVSLEKLVSSSKRFCAALLEHGDRSRLKLHLAKEGLRRRREEGGGLLSKLPLNPLPPARIWVSDHGQAFTFDLDAGLAPSPLTREECDLAADSDSLHYAFIFLWGGESLLVNGRFEELRPGGRNALFDYFHTSSYMNFGNEIRWEDLTRGVVRRATQALEEWVSVLR